jgi:hypothetical protein
LQQNVAGRKVCSNGARIQLARGEDAVGHFGPTRQYPPPGFLAAATDEQKYGAAYLQFQQRGKQQAFDVGPESSEVADERVVESGQFPAYLHDFADVGDGRDVAGNGQPLKRYILAEGPRAQPLFPFWDGDPHLTRSSEERGGHGALHNSGGAPAPVPFPKSDEGFMNDHFDAVLTSTGALP